MGNIIKNNFFFYVEGTLMFTFGLLAICYSIFRYTKSVERKRVKLLIRIGASTVLTILWAYFWVYLNLYPISLAYYEYGNDLTEERIGVLDSIEIETRDRVCVTVDGKKYTLIYHDDMMTNDEGDTVKIKYGKHSKFIFDICEFSENP